MGWGRFEIIYQHQYWRLLTGILVHANLWHWLMNVGALLLIAAIFGKQLSLKHWGIISLIMTLIANGLLLLQVQTRFYVGLSGLLHGLLVYVALHQFTRAKLESSLILTAIALKIYLEFIFPQGLGDQQLISVPVATIVHRYFCFTAIICFIIFTKIIKRYEWID
ncbi:rhombosortase [Celerinatantimonas sp. YJH-8]|uniref:rhombosortase n=1 Tax=Celerinatantimonas sp. YJH-8 TaxID=3228714 RepID=UPI0038C12494